MIMWPLSFHTFYCQDLSAFTIHIDKQSVETTGDQQVSSNLAMSFTACLDNNDGITCKKLKVS